MAANSEDAYVRSAKGSWTIGTASVERVIEFRERRLIDASFINKRTGHELSAGASSGDWQLVRTNVAKLKQGELKLDIILQRQALQVTKSYVVYPGSNIIREWSVLKNAGTVPIVVTDPDFLFTAVKLGNAAATDFHWLTGASAASAAQSWALRTEELQLEKARTFDSNDPFPAPGGITMGLTSSGSYGPWGALYNRETKEGLFLGWDYFGHWQSSYLLNKDGSVTARVNVAGHKQTLAPGETLETPKSFIGLFEEDLDVAGNELLNWQYRYMWDYTRDGWFPAIRVLGDWGKGTLYANQAGPDWQWTGGNPDQKSLFRKIFRLADLMRYVGADVYHRDWGWWDRAGDWNGPDFAESARYLRKSQMGQLIYAFLYTVDLESKVAREHPDWILNPDGYRGSFDEGPWAGLKWHLNGGTLDMSRPEVVQFLKEQLDDFVRRWGDFEWRNDHWMTSQQDGDDTPMLGQDQGMRELLRGFLDQHPNSAFQAVNGGGQYAGGPDYTRYASSISVTDAGGGPLRNYWVSLLIPPDKTSDDPNAWNVDKYDKASWRGALAFNVDLSGDTLDTEKLEGVRELIDIYHYLQSQGVVGRWVKVYRPLVTGDDPTAYFQRLSGDGKRGIIIPKRSPSGPVTIRPKGLDRDAEYVVSFQESEHSEQRRGADLMAHGISLQQMAPGELVYLNLPLHPGSKREGTAPTPPSDCVARPGTNMGYPGVEIDWKPGSDDSWISYYEIYRDGIAIDKVAKGTFYFDHSAGADLAAKYEIRTVDGAGNASARAAAASVQNNDAPRAIVIDDADAAIIYSGHWVAERHPPLGAHNGTMTVSDRKGATAELSFEGARVLLFGRMGPEGGKASISVDGGPAEIVDTYSADMIWGVPIYMREFDSVGHHVMRIEVLGDRDAHPNEQSNGSTVSIDAVRIELR